jgi:hypothetical protein
MNAPARMEPWVQLYSGRALDLVNPLPEQISLHDMAWSLSHLNRWTGHTCVPFPVSQHSTLVGAIVLRLIPNGEDPTIPVQWALIHDGGEAGTGDLSSPLKRLLRHDALLAELRSRVCADLELHPDLLALVMQSIALAAAHNPDISEVQRRIQRAITDRFGLPPDEPPIVKLADLMALALERDQLMGPSERAWGWDPPTPIDRIKIEPMSPSLARVDFMQWCNDWDLRDPA